VSEGVGVAGAARLRPTFTVPIRVDRQVAVEAIRARLTDDERFAGRWRGKGRWAELYVPHEQRRFWSPHLSIRLDEEAGRCTLFGRFAPHPEIWTLFMFFYIGIAFLAVFGAILGYVQWVSSESAWGLWAVWIGLPLLALIHAAGAVGQRLGQDQMAALKEELDRVLEGL